MPMSPPGILNLAALTVPGVYVQVTPPNTLLNGVPTNLIALVGTANWGPVNSPIIFGTMQDYKFLFGDVDTNQYDLGTIAYACTLKGASNFLGVRVTDGTDTAASSNLLDASSGVGAILTAIYTGDLGDTIIATIGLASSYTPSAPTYKLSIYINAGVPEVFDNIGGTGADFWQNLVDAVNLGQSTARGPSQIVIASLPDDEVSVNVTSAGSYGTLPSLSTTGPGSGATFVAHMKAVSAVKVAGGSGYLAGDTITLAGGTNTTPTVITVDSVTSGAITTFHVSTAGNYTALPTSPVGQASTSGIGTGATFNLFWGLLSIAVTVQGSGYDNTSAIVISGGNGAGGAATLIAGSTGSPSQQDYPFDGGSNGNDGVTSATLVGDDSANPPTGMYALRNQVGSALLGLADADDPTYWPEQSAFSLSESCYVIGTMAPGYQDNISGAATLLQNSGINNYGFSLMFGDWVQINDPFNNVTRFISPQGFKLGVLASIQPNDSSANKQLPGVLATQKTNEGKSYTTANLAQIGNSRLEIITRPQPGGYYFGCTFANNTSSNSLEKTDNYPRMVNFLGITIMKGMGPFVGLPQSSSVRDEALAAVQRYLMNLFNLGMIEDVNNPGDPKKAFIVILDDTNNPPDRVALGYMQCDVRVVLQSIVLYLVVNLTATQGSVNVVSVTPNSPGAI